jgi:hypothetical protein
VPARLEIVQPRDLGSLRRPRAGFQNERIRRGTTHHDQHDHLKRPGGTTFSTHGAPTRRQLLFHTEAALSRAPIASRRSAAGRPRGAWRRRSTSARYLSKAVVVWRRPGVRSRLRRGTRPENASRRGADLRRVSMAECLREWAFSDAPEGAPVTRLTSARLDGGSLATGSVAGGVARRAVVTPRRRRERAGRFGPGC